MGKQLLQQRRGKGSVFKTPDHRLVASVRYPPFVYSSQALAQVTDIIDDPGKTTPLARIVLPNGAKFYAFAAEGLAVGDRLSVGALPSVSIGSVMPLSSVPDGTPIFNIEVRPGDGGRLSRSSGTSAFVVAHDEETRKVTVHLSSKRVLTLSPNCFATVGVASGGGRLEKPLKKAGAAFYAAKARGRYYPRVRGTAMNAYDHPYGGRTGGKPTTVKRSTPPGRKAGHVAARATGRKKARRLEEPAANK